MSSATRFNALWSRLCDAPAEPGWAGLDAHYREPQRAYHDWAHIDSMLSALDHCRSMPAFANAAYDMIEAAIYFHDAIYDPRAQDNEEQSAALFRRYAADDMDCDAVNRIAAMIHATASHGPGEDPSTALLLDLDLMVLGASPADYNVYVSKVRREYAFVPEDQWRSGRTAVLQRLLGKPTIYQTTYFRKHLEAQARSNLSVEIERLNHLE